MNSDSDSRAPSRGTSDNLFDRLRKKASQQDIKRHLILRRQSRGPHRQGYSEEKCRSILVRECSKIPRNFNYVDGIHMVVEKLRTHLGDENLDLSIGVLYEFIEVNDTLNTWEESSAFRRWAHDHSLRKSDLLNSHTPRLGNIIVGCIQPTERLRQWREHIRSQEGFSASEATRTRSIDLPRPSFSHTHGIRNRHSWQINHSVFVSNPVTGTNVLYCPSPKKLNEISFSGGVGRGNGKLVEERILHDDRVDFQDSLNSPLSPPPSTSGSNTLKTPETWPESVPSVGTKKPSLVTRGYKVILNPVLELRSKQKKSRQKENDTLGEFRRSASVDILRQGFRNSDLSLVSSAPLVDMSDVVLKEAPIPLDSKVNGAFSRKFGLVDRGSQLPGEIERFAMDSAEEKVLRDAAARKLSPRERFNQDGVPNKVAADTTIFNGPFTAELFKDGGLDYRWKPAQPGVPEESEDVPPGSAR